MRTSSGSGLLLSVMVGLLAVFGTVGMGRADPPGAFGPEQNPTGATRTVTDVDFLGIVTFPTGFEFAATEVGGLSGLAFDPYREHYYALSDDRSDVNPARFYTLRIDVADGALDPGDVTFTGVTTLLDAAGDPFGPGALDPEGIALARPGHLYVSSEGDAGESPAIDPFVRRYNVNGRQTAALPVPDQFLPATDRGVRTNLGFESLTVTPANRTLFTATEAALVQDGPVADLGQSSPARIIQYDLARRTPVAQYVYVVEPVAEPPVPPDAFRVNGLVELQALDAAGTLLALERSFSVGAGNTVGLYEITTRGATDVARVRDLRGVSFDPVDKRLLVRFSDFGIEPDNLEALAFGPRLADDRVPLIVVSDNNFSPSQVTQFVALALTVKLEE